MSLYIALNLMLEFLEQFHQHLVISSKIVDFNNAVLSPN